MPIGVIAPAVAEPVTLAEAKAHLRVTDTAQDALLATILIPAAREQAEKICWRAIPRQTWIVALDQFPRPAMNVSSANWYGPQWGTSPGPLTVVYPDGTTGYEILLPPANAVNSVKYVDTAGTLQTLDAAKYKLDKLSIPNRLTPSYGNVWPDTRNETNAVQVELDVGYEVVPASIKQWMLLHIGSRFENREAEMIVQRGSMISIAAFDQLLTNHRAFRFG